jgi:hypothetical protein
MYAMHVEFSRQAARDHLQLLQKESVLRRLLRKGI